MQGLQRVASEIRTCSALPYRPHRNGAQWAALAYARTGARYREEGESLTFSRTRCPPKGVGKEYVLSQAYPLPHGSGLCISDRRQLDVDVSEA